MGGPEKFKLNLENGPEKFKLGRSTIFFHEKRVKKNRPPSAEIFLGGPEKFKLASQNGPKKFKQAAVLSKPKKKKEEA